jgi:multidrug resistance efflux pump
MEHREKGGTPALIARYLRRRWRLPAQIAVMVVMGLALMGSLPFHRKRDHAIRTGPGTGPVVVSGEVQSLYSRAVGSPFDGTVSQVAVRPGQKVRRGEVLFRMDARPLRQALEAAKADRVAAAQYLSQTRAECRADLATLEGTITELAAQIERARDAAAGEDSETAAVEAEEAGYELVAHEPAETSEDASAQSGELEARLAAARAQLEEQRLAWQPALSAALEGAAEARTQVRRWEGLLAAATRHSPCDGIITGVYIGDGQRAHLGQPLVRVDRPAGYRVVTLVDDHVRAAVKPGDQLSVARPGKRCAGKVEKIVAGCDKLVFKYWLWLKPVDPQGLMPGQKVEVRVPDRLMVASN